MDLSTRCLGASNVVVISQISFPKMWCRGTSKLNDIFSRFGGKGTLEMSNGNDFLVVLVGEGGDD